MLSPSVVVLLGQISNIGPQTRAVNPRNSKIAEGRQHQSSSALTGRLSILTLRHLTMKSDRHPKYSYATQRILTNQQLSLGIRFEMLL
jgi:hypothetical protein